MEAVRWKAVFPGIEVTSSILAIDLKTLHRWMTLSRLSAESHPLDTRLKCLTSTQIQQLAITHRRLLPDLEPLRCPPEAIALATPTVGTSASPVSGILPDLSLRVTELTKQLSVLQAQAATLQSLLN